MFTPSTKFYHICKPKTITLTEEHFKILFGKTIITEHSRILDGLLTAQSAATPAPNITNTARGNSEDADKHEGEAETACEIPLFNP